VKELDVVLTRYLESGYDKSTDADKQAFENLLDYEDPEILRFLLNQERPVDEKIARIIEKIRR
jgi:antitoxin CptB